MIKIGDVRFNPDEIKKYYPLIDPQDNHCIVFAYRGLKKETEVIRFGSREERDETLEAMDEVFLLVKDGKIVQRIMDMPSSFMFEDGGVGGPGGFHMQ